jgi:hypothetical protein
MAALVGTLAVSRVARSGPEHRGIRMAYRLLPEYRVSITET